MVTTRIACTVCGLLGFWAYKREQSVFEMIRDSHLKMKGENHEVTMEITDSIECEDES